MSKVIIVSKTHLDLGFTGMASEILASYCASYFPKAIDVARKVNADGKKFVWTVGAWLLKAVLEMCDDNQRSVLQAACKAGDIVAHAMPFTTHTELMDKSLAEYGLSIIKELDREFGWKTTAAKMTDVPGHSIAIVPILAEAGIKLLHIGVNGASKVPSVPPAFVWRHCGKEVIVVYDQGYGGEFATDVIDDVLYFDHALDNHGPRDEGGVINNFNRIKSRYPRHEVVAGTLSDYAELLWAAKDKLPVVTQEIGDTWIHGGATDPYKIAAFKELLALKTKWINEGSMHSDTAEYRGLMDSLLCVAEHTWGSDVKVFFGDFTNYLKKDFTEARGLDRIIKRKGIYRLKCMRKLAQNGKTGRYSRIEASWAEQREYINAATKRLSATHRSEADERLSNLLPKAFTPDFQTVYAPMTPINVGNINMSINKMGGIHTLACGDTTMIKGNNNAALEYHSYGKADYDFWRDNYTRNFMFNRIWSEPDFLRPHLGSVDKKYRQGRFSYCAEGISLRNDGERAEILVNIKIDEYCYRELGAPLSAQIKYTVAEGAVEVELVWLDKPASRLTEALMMRFYPSVSAGQTAYRKIGSMVSPYDVVVDGNRNISAVEEVVLGVQPQAWAIVNHHSPLVSLGKGKILQFDNKYEDIAKDGIAFILCNNVWGTNFPQWYEGSAKFNFTIAIK